VEGVVRLTEDQKRAYELVLYHLKDYSEYHHRKEKAAYAVAVLYFGAAVPVVVGPAFWAHYSLPHMVVFVLFLLASAAGAIIYVRWQLRRRERAACIAAACVTVLSRWLTRPPTEADLQPERIAPLVAAVSTRGVEFPAALAQEFNEVERQRPRLWLPTKVTLGLMILWAAIVFVKAVTSYQGVSAMTVNLWSVIGLLLDILGVVGVAFIPERWGTAIFGGGFDLEEPARSLYQASWGSIILGFLLQFVGQFVK
jgi:hypothetical protein